MLDKSPEQQIALIREAAITLLARREHSQSELLRKLEEKGFSSELCAQVVQQLQAEGYQSQRRFVEMWIKNRVAKYYGENKIRSELAQHQISTSMITEMLSESDVDWFELCLQSYEKKFGKNADFDWSVRQKQKRHLWHRGFTEEQILYVLSAANEES